MFSQSYVNDHVFTCQGPVRTHKRKQNEVDSQLKEASKTTATTYSTKKVAYSTKREATKVVKLECPMCNQKFNDSDINNHAFTCQGPVPTLNRKQKSETTVGPDFDVPWWDGQCGVENIVNNKIKTNLQDETKARTSFQPDIWKHDTPTHKTFTLRNGAQHAKMGIKKVDILEPMKSPNKRLSNKLERKRSNKVKKYTADEVAIRDFKWKWKYFWYSIKTKY